MADEDDYSYYEDDDGFAYYVRTAVDPGWSLFAATTLFCILSNVMLPCMIAMGRKHLGRHHHGVNNTTLWDDEEEEEDDDLLKEEDISVIDAISSVDEQEIVWKGGATTTSSKATSSRGGTSHSRYGGSSTIGGRSVMSKRSKASSMRSRATTSALEPYLSQNTLQRLAAHDPQQWKHHPASDIGGHHDHAQGARSIVSSAAGARSTISFTGSYVSAVTTTVLDGGFIGPRGGKARRRRGAEGRRRLLEQEYMESMRRNHLNDNNLEKEQQEQHHGHHHPDVAAAPFDLQSEVSSVTHRSSSRQHHHHGSGGGALSITASSQEVPSSTTTSPQENLFMTAPPEPYALEDVDLCCGEHAWWKPKTFQGAYQDLLDIANWDSESKRLVQLAVPFSLAEIIEGVFELVVLGLIAQYIGTKAVSAYTVVELMVGLTSELTGGILETTTVLCPHAIGARNYKLAGQYVQIASVLYVVLSIPFLIMWMFLMQHVMLWFGFDLETAQIAQAYTNVVVFSDLLSGVHEVYVEFLCVIDYETYAVVMSIVEEALAFVVILISVLARPNTSLADVALLSFFVEIFMFFINVAYTVKKGWMNRYLPGMVGNWALRNRTAVKTMLATATPLCIGSLMSYGEWEILTIFAGAIGPAEVAAWGILGSLWETLEAAVDGFADSGEIRCAYHLGAGRPARAKRAAYKALLLGFFASSLLTSIIFIFGENLAYWFTSDPTLQHMIVELLPLVGLGNITLTVGSISWSLVGAQMRYRMATIVFIIFSWGVTVPLAALFIYGFNLNLQGLVAAVVLGYSVAGTTVTFILAVSDWSYHCRKIVAANEWEEEEESDDEEGEEGEEESASVTSHSVTPSQSASQY